MAFRFYDPEQVGGMLIYEGSRRQRGGNFLKETLLPIGKRLFNRATRQATKIGKDLAVRSIKGAWAVSKTGCTVVPMLP